MDNTTKTNGKVSSPTTPAQLPPAIVVEEAAATVAPAPDVMAHAPTFTADELKALHAKAITATLRACYKEQAIRAGRLPRK